MKIQRQNFFEKISDLSLEEERFNLFLEDDKKFIKDLFLDNLDTLFNLLENQKLSKEVWKIILDFPIYEELKLNIIGANNIF